MAAILTRPHCVNNLLASQQIGLFANLPARADSIIMHIAAFHFSEHCVFTVIFKTKEHQSVLVWQTQPLTVQCCQFCILNRVTDFYLFGISIMTSKLCEKTVVHKTEHFTIDLFCYLRLHIPCMTCNIVIQHQLSEYKHRTTIKVLVWWLCIMPLWITNRNYVPYCIRFGAE